MSDGRSYRDLDRDVPPAAPRPVAVTGALSWWDEPPEALDACIRGLGGVVDRVVALDGAYARYPGAAPRSPRGQAEAIRDAAREAGIGCTVVTVDRLWAGQVEKRSHLLALASAGTDWIASVDADHVVCSPDREAVRAALAREVAVDVFEVPFATPPPPPGRSLEDAAAGLWHRGMSGTTTPIPHLFRALPGLRVERFHWWYSAWKGAQRVWLWGGPDGAPRAAHGMLPVPGYGIEHRCLQRDDAHVRANRAFCSDRELVKRLTGQEDHAPGLPEPVFDFEAVLV